MPEAKRSRPIKITASDDLALASLELRYTKVSGSGEQFEFVEGALPVRVTRESGRQWRADAQMALATLNLAAGDSLVYRAVARDGRPGDAGMGASDTYFIEIAGPGEDRRQSNENLLPTAAAGTPGSRWPRARTTGSPRGRR